MHSICNFWLDCDHSVTPDFHAVLLTWLDSGTNAQKRHAAYRLSLPDAIGYEVPATYPMLPPIPDYVQPVPGVPLSPCGGCPGLPKEGD